MKAMLRLALRNIGRHRARTAMNLAAIVLGACALVLTGGFVADVYEQLGESLIHSNSGHLQLARTGFFETGTRRPEDFLVDDVESVRKRVRAIPGVDDAMARIAFSGLLNNGRTDMPVLGEGVEPEKEAKLGTAVRVVEGRGLAAKDADGAVVGKGLARALGLKPGDRIVLLVSAGQGALNTLDLTVTGVFESFSKDYDARALRITLDAARELLATRGANTLVVSLARTPDTARVAQALRDATLPGLEVRTWMQINDYYAKTVELYDRQFGILRFIVLLMVLLSVANSVNMSVFERIGEFGTMRALGRTGRSVVLLIVGENLLLGLIGGVLGAALAVVLALVLSAIGLPMPPPPNANVGYTAHILLIPLEIALAVAISVAATGLACVLPALRAARIPVVDALRAGT